MVRVISWSQSHKAPRCPLWRQINNWQFLISSHTLNVTLAQNKKKLGREAIGMHFLCPQSTTNNHKTLQLRHSV